ncbi:AsmA-like C-terminal region-containing protein [Hymenobacter rubidus]|uniref:AsmA-like C-terminal region-containing protein n=1 Tax=Hymenobacter rubidus TaxID=1441626 RepID=UPI00191CB941|nr:AsmA-like C-terminal region-containing protein [Hymenobacter rubidus]
MKSFPLRRVLASVVLLGIVGAGVAVWVLGSDYGRRLVAQKVRTALTQNSELVLAPFEVEISPWRDFPHLTASIQHISLTDTSFRQHMPVLQVGRADLRVELLSLLRGRVQVRRVVVNDVDFRERVDSLGRAWGLRGKRRKGTGKAPTINLILDELVVNNFHFSSHNGYSRSQFGVAVRQAQLTARLRGGVLRVGGTLDGELSYLRTRAGTLFEQKPVMAWVNYKYTFANHQGQLYRTRATLNGDTIRVSGTHTVDPDQPAGTFMNLSFVGDQPLTEVLHAALPPRLEPYLEGATSPSKAHIHYTITGLSGPMKTPRNVLTFGLRGASLQWPGPARRIDRWDLQGTYDNGPAHHITSTVLTLRQCRIYSPAGQLDIGLTLTNFRRPFLNGRFRGSAELVQLAAVVSPGRWRARAGTADINVQLRGLLPPPPNRPAPPQPQKPLSLRGTVVLHQASFLLPARGADLSRLNVRVGLRDSLWQLSNASGTLNAMKFQASATTVYLLDYLTGQHATASISGQFAVDELRVASLRTLLRPVPRTNSGGFAPTSLPKPAPRPRSQASKAQLAATLGSELIPAGLRLNVRLRCQRLLLATDTLNNLAVDVHHDGQQVQLLNIAGVVWGGQVRGNVQWPTDPDNRVAPVQYQLSVHFDTLNYQQFLARLNRPVVRPGKQPAARRAKGSGASASSPALRDLLLAANGQVDLNIDRVQLPEDESMSRVSLRLIKAGPSLRMPYLRFRTPEGGFGEASGTAQVEALRLTAADADVTLRYATLDVQRLLGLIASLTAPTDSVLAARAQARAERRATRRAARQQLPGNHSLLANGVLSAVLRVEADQVHYGAINGSRFHFVSHLLDGEARLDNCSFDALQGHLSVRGYMRSTVSRTRHPTRLQLHLQDVQLPALFATASSLGLSVLSADNIKGTLSGVADVRTNLGATFLPEFPQTAGYLKTNFRDLELLNVEVLMEALKFMKSERTSHLYFEPVTGEFLLAQGQLIIPGLHLNSNLSNLEVSGHYGLDGATNLYIGLKPLQALFGNNNKRIERIQSGEPVSHSNNGKLTYVNLRRTAPKEKYSVRLFQRDEHREAMNKLSELYRNYLLTQRLDTTVKLLR